MPIGVKQILLLRICKDQGYITLSKVKEIYNLPSGGRNYWACVKQSNISISKITILETYGLLKIENKKTGIIYCIITELGENVIQEWERKQNKRPIDRVVKA